MEYKLENENLIVLASTYGAELHSIKEKADNTEYLWNGDEKYWKCHAPVLFPIVGKVNGGKYKVEGKEYELPQHGLARVREFEVVCKSETTIVFQLNYDEKTLKVYPYKFTLRIGYALFENGIETSYEVINMDQKEIYFSIGAHPAFLCPIVKGESFNDYYFKFSEEENCQRMLLNKDGNLTDKKGEGLNNSAVIKLNQELFKDDALIFDNLSSTEISLLSNKSNKGITMDFSGFPYLGLWSKPSGAPFVCIEPWYGHADYEDFSGEFKEKEGVQRLAVGESFKASYTVTIK